MITEVMTYITLSRLDIDKLIFNHIEKQGYLKSDRTPHFTYEVDGKKISEEKEVYVKVEIITSGMKNTSIERVKIGEEK